jgi:hypothetical protein
MLGVSCTGCAHRPSSSASRSYAGSCAVHAAPWRVIGMRAEQLFKRGVAARSARGHRCNAAVPAAAVTDGRLNQLECEETSSKAKSLQSRVERWIDWRSNTQCTFSLRSPPTSMVRSSRSVCVRRSTQGVDRGEHRTARGHHLFA